MNEVEKMYENCNIKKQYCGWLDMGDLDTQYTYIRCDSLKEFNDTAMMSRTSYSSEEEDWDKPSIEYPPFTAEKQLELIKWLAYKMHITIGKGLPWGQYDDDWWTITSKKGYAGTNAHKFEEALANFVNCFWQELTAEEHKQIKEVLSE